MVCCHKCSVWCDVRLDWASSSMVTLSGMGGVHPGLADWQEKCFIAILKVSWFGFTSGKGNDVKLLERKGKLCKRPGVPSERLSPAPVIAGVSSS